MFAGVNPYANFTVTIKPSSMFGFYVKKPPYFNPELQTQNISQCPNVERKPWSFILPNRIDPNYREVKVDVSFNKTFFTFDNERLVLTERKSTLERVNQTINVTLSNELNLTITYQMLIVYFCNQTLSEERNFTTNDSKEVKSNFAFISQIDPSGLMRVRFGRKMKIPDHPEWIQTQTTTIDGVKYPNLKIEVIKGRYSDEHLLEINNWTLVAFKSYEMLIQLNFTNKKYVSSHDLSKDSIKMTIYGFSLFQDELGRLISPQSVLQQRQMPLMDSESNLLKASELGRNVQRAVLATLFVNTVLSFLIKGPLKVILDTVKQLQIIVHVFLINVAYPATAIVCFGMLMQVLTFQLYDFSDFYNQVLGLDPESDGNQPLNDHFNLMGYSSMYLIQNFGTMCWTLLIVPISWLASLILSFLSKGRFASLRQKFSGIMFFDFWILFLFENYIFLAVCACLNLSYLRWGSYGDAINNFFSIYTGLLAVLFPIFVMIFYSAPNNYKRILDRAEDFLRRWGSILTDLNFKRRGRIVLLLTCSTMVVQLWLACIVVFNKDKQVFNIMMVNMQALCMMIVAGYSEAMIDRTANKMNQINQAFVLLFTYHLYQFTEFMTDLDNRDKVGRSLVVITIANVALNFCVISSQTLVLTLTRLKLLYKRSKQRTKIRQQRKRLMKLLAERDGILKRWQEEKRMLKVLRQPEIHLQESFDFLNYLVSQQAKSNFYSENKISSDEFKSSDHQTNSQCSQQDSDARRFISVKVKPFRPGQGLGRIVVPIYEQQEHDEQKKTLPGAKTLSTMTQKDFNQTLEVEEQKEIDDASRKIRVSDQNRFGNLSKTRNTSQLHTLASANQVHNQIQNSAQAQPKTLSLNEIVQQLARQRPPIRNFQYLQKNFPPNFFQVEKNNGAETKMSAQYSEELDQIQKPNQGRDASTFEVQAAQDLSIRDLALQEQVIRENTSSLLGIEEQQLSGDAYIKYQDEADYLNSEQLDRAQYQNERMNVLLSHPLNQSSNSSFRLKHSSFKTANDAYGERSASQLSIRMRNQNHAKEIIAPSIVNHLLMSERPVSPTDNEQASSQIQNLQHSTDRKIPDRSKVTVVSIFQSQNKKVKESLAQLQKITGRKFSGSSNSPMKKKGK